MAGEREGRKGRSSSSSSFHEREKESWREREDLDHEEYKVSVTPPSV